MTSGRLKSEEKMAGEALVQRTFPITAAQDAALNEWAEKLPNFPKGFIVRIVIELGLASFAESAITQKMLDGSIRLWRDELTEGGAGRKTKTRAKRRA